MAWRLIVTIVGSSLLWICSNRPVAAVASSSSINCLYVRGHFINSETAPEHRCSLENEFVYNLPEVVLDQLNDDDDIESSLKSGITRLFLTGVEIQGDEMVVVVPEDELRVVKFEDNVNIFGRQQRQRRRERERSSMGVRSIIVVRVQSRDALNVSLSTAELEYSFFDSTDTTFANQYRLCSAGELNFLPAVVEDLAPNGVGDLFLNLELAGTGMTNFIENFLTASFESKYGSVAQFDHILFCMPEGMNEGWKGYTYGNTWRSYYEDPWCGYYTMPMHEVGHNLGMKHSMEDGDEYGDRSCLMSTSYSSVRSPRMCFNGAKMWQMGWYPNYRIEVNPARDGPWRGKLIGFVDFEILNQNDPNNVVLINIGDLYLLHNRLKGFNSQSVGHGNQVTVARAPTLDSKSDLLIGLRPSEPETIVDVELDGETRQVVIEICERILGDIISYDLSIHLDIQTSACGPTMPPINLIPTPPPSPRPTQIPVTPSPSSQPSSSPAGPSLPLRTSAPTTVTPTLFPTSPEPTTSAGSSLNACFSDRMHVELESKKVISMKDLKIGDVVKSNTGGDYSRVYAFGHRDVHLHAEYLQFHLRGGGSLEISPDHLIFVTNYSSVPASTIKVGDTVLVDRGSDFLTTIKDPAVVLSIQRVLRKGAFAPFTESGSIIVNQVLASAYVTLQPNESHLVVAGYKTPFSHQWLAHFAVAPIRAGVVPARIIPFLQRASSWMLQQHPVILSVMMILVLAVLVICSLPEYLIGHLFILLAGAWFFLSQRKAFILGKT